METVWLSEVLILIALLVVAVCAVELDQYCRFFIRGNIYDPVTESLLRASSILT